MTSLKDAVDDYVEWGLAGKTEGTAQSYRSHVRGFARWVADYNDICGGCESVDEHGLCSCADEVPVDSIQREHVKRNLKSLARDGKSQPTIETRMVVIRDFLRSQHPQDIDELDINLREESIIQRWGQTRQEREENDRIYYLTPDEIEELIDNVPEPSFRNELIVRLLWQTGMRQTQLVNVTLDDVDLDDRRIDIWSNKSKKPYSVWYGPSLQPMMQQWLNVERRALAPSVAERSEYLFPSSRTEQMRAKSINDHIVKPAAEDAGMQSRSYEDSIGRDRGKVTGHVLRHSFAVQFVRDGGDIRRLQQLMGHSDIETTEKYLRFKDDEIRKARAQHGPQ